MSQAKVFSWLGVLLLGALGAVTGWGVGWVIWFYVPSGPVIVVGAALMCFWVCVILVLHWWLGDRAVEQDAQGDD
jgi:hypothetical protein